MIIITDDMSPENIKYFKHWDDIKEKHPSLKLLVFTIANYKNEQDVSKSEDFREWFDVHKDWIEVGVHGYDHEYPPEQERDNAEDLVVNSLKILKNFLPARPLYRPPGFQRTIYTESMLKRLGFRGIAYQKRIKMFNGAIIEPVFNTHCCDKYINPITRWRGWISQIS